MKRPCIHRELPIRTTLALPLPVIALAYRQHLLALASMRQCYKEALREPAHEAEALRGGRCLQDLRLFAP